MWEIRKLTKYNKEGSYSTEDKIALEEPLQILVQRPHELPETLSITMRTPGDDEALALGFMFGEGMIGRDRSIKAVSVSPEAVVVLVPESFTLGAGEKRNFYMTSSCGVCGKSSIESLKINKDPIEVTEQINSKIFSGLYQEMLATQNTYTSTGGCHSAGIFTLTGSVLSICEDVGRHNALDKCVGHIWMNRRNMTEQVIVCLSGRACYELIQKSAMISAACVISVGAPTSLAIETAEAMGITLIRFFNQHEFNVFAHPERIQGRF